jgi:rifampicin phosphotransferase
VEARLDPVRRVLFRRFLRVTQDEVRLRDNGRYYLWKIRLPTARLCRTLARRWVERGWLNTTDDFFFLTVFDVEAIVQAGDPAAAGLDVRGLVSGRRKAYEHWLGVDAPEVIGPNGRQVAESPRDQPPDAVLVGVPVSRGQASGTARVVRDPGELSRLKPGDILVTRATDAGWTPVFPLLAGLVLEIGGQLSHGAIVAREYGVPTVANVLGATRHIRDGQALTVDATAGRVYFDNSSALEVAT